MSTRQPTRSVGSTNIIALDLGENAVRVVEMELGGGGDATATHLLRRGSAPLPASAWADLNTNRDAFINAIRSAMSAAGITGRSVVASIPRRLVTVRFARLPSAPPDQMKGMVQFEAQQYILFSLDDVQLDYHAMQEPLAGFGMPDGDDLETVLLVAARRTLVTDLLAIFDKSGLELRQLSVSALALAEHARDVLEPTALIDIQPGSMDVAVVADGRLLFTRATSLDLEGIAPEVAQRKLQEEVARSFTSYQNEFRNKILSHVYISGASITPRDAERLERSLSSILEMPVTRLHNRLLPASDPDVVAYATATGMGLQTRPDALAPISLVPDERAETKARRAKQLQKTLVGALGLAAFVGGYVWLSDMSAKGAAADRAKIVANNDLKTAKTALTAYQKTHDKQQAFTGELDKGLDRKHLTVDVVVALHAALPPTKDIWLTQMAYQRGGQLTLRGESKTATAPTDMVIALQASGAFYDVKLGELGDAQETVPVAAVAAPAPQEETNDVPVGPLPGMNPAGGPTGAGNPGMPQPGTFMPTAGQPGVGFQPGTSQPGPGFQPGNGFPPGTGFQPGNGGRFPPNNGGGFQPPNPSGGGATPQPPTAVPGGQPSGQPIIITPDAGPAPIQIVVPPNQSSSSRSNPERVASVRFHRQTVPMNGSPGRNRGNAPAGMGQRFPGNPVNPQQSPGPLLNPQQMPGQMPLPQSGAVRNPGVTLAPRASSTVVGRTSSTGSKSRQPKSNRVTRTSFIITCRVNPNCTDLLAGLSLPGQKGAGKTTPIVASKVTKPADTDDSNGGGDDNGN